MSHVKFRPTTSPKAASPSVAGKRQSRNSRCASASTLVASFIHIAASPHIGVWHVFCSYFCDVKIYPYFEPYSMWLPSLREPQLFGCLFSWSRVELFFMLRIILSNLHVVGSPFMLLVFRSSVSHTRKRVYSSVQYFFDKRTPSVQGMIEVLIHRAPAKMIH